MTQAKRNSDSSRGLSRAFAVRRDGALSIHVQLLEQLKHHIEERTWGPGAQLPPAQHLAGSLGIHSNTVRAVYLELERAGYVVSAQGRGTFVAADSPAGSDALQRVHDLLDEAVLQARRLGLSPDDLARHAFLRARIFTPHAVSVRMLFVECTRWDVETQGRAIAEGTGVTPAGILVRDYLEKGADYLDRFDVIATTLFHVTEVQRKAGRDRRVFTLMLEPSFEEVVARLLPLRQGTRIAIVCSSRSKADKYVSSLLARGLNHLRYVPVGVTNRAALKQAFQKADQVWISKAVADIWKGPWPADKPVFHFVQVIDATSLRLLRRFVGEVESRGQASAQAAAAGAVSV